MARRVIQNCTHIREEIKEMSNPIHVSSTWACCKCSRSNCRELSMRGFWKCCRCNHLNNPAYSPQRCGSCGHGKCAACVVAKASLTVIDNTSCFSQQIISARSLDKCGKCGHTKCSACRSLKLPLANINGFELWNSTEDSRFFINDLVVGLPSHVTAISSGEKRHHSIQADDILD